MSHLQFALRLAVATVWALPVGRGKRVLGHLSPLADRIVVMSEGRAVHETPIGQADIAVIGRHMAGHA